MSARFKTTRSFAAGRSFQPSFVSRAQAFLGLSAFLAIVVPASAARSQQQPATIFSKTADNAATGTLGVWDFAGTDMTFKAGKNEIWIVDTYSSPVTIINKFKADDLAAGRTSTVINLPADVSQAPVLGIAEITNGAFKGKNLILVDPAFGTANPPQPEIAIYEDDGNIVAGESFVPVGNVDPTAQLASIAFNPAREEIAVYDMKNHAFYILDSTFGAFVGPIAVEGFPSFFINSWFFGSVDRQGLRGAGAGIAYNGPDKLLVSSDFYNFWDTRFVLEYDLATDGGYTGRAIDLSAAGVSGLNPELAFVGMDIGKVGGEQVLFAHNFGDDSIYAFSVTLESHAPPVSLTACGVTTTGEYGMNWNLPTGATIDSIRVFENGSEVATLGPTETQYFGSVSALLGKAFLEVATEKGGLTSGLRPVCQVQNSGRAPLPNLQFDATQITTLGRVLSGVAVTKTPATPDEFRGYVIGQDSNDVVVFDYLLNVIDAEALVLDPRVVRPQGSTNLAAMGVALYKIDGVDNLAVLDADGPSGGNVPSCIVYGLEGVNRGRQVKEFNPIDLSALSPTPFLRDWDTTPDNNFVAGGFLSGTNDYVIVRIVVTGDTMAATQMVPVPQRLLTPFSTAPITGCGVSALPSGYLLVAGSDTFSKTYTEALLMTPFVDAGAGGDLLPPKFVGYAQGLLLANQFGAPANQLGPGIGPRAINGLDTAFFEFTPDGADQPQTAGVTYLPTGEIALISNPSTNQTLRTADLNLFQRANACSRPDLAAEQLADVSVELSASQKGGTGAVAQSFAPGAAVADYFLYVMNQSTTDSEKLTLEVKLDGTVVPEASQKVVLPAGRYFRRTIPARAEDTLEVSVTNNGTASAPVRIITGAMGTGTVAPPGTKFRRGDCDGNDIVNLTDAIVGLNWLFKSGPAPACPDTADADDDGKIGLTDMIIMVNYLFKSGPLPPDPGPIDCGVDPTDDTLGPCVYTCQ